MNPGGVVLLIAALWIGTQTLGGQALERLGLLDASGAATTTGTTGSSTSSSTSSTSATPTKTVQQQQSSGYTTPTPRLLVPKPV